MAHEQQSHHCHIRSIENAAGYAMSAQKVTSGKPDTVFDKEVA
jgi:hypothetical protein